MSVCCLFRFFKEGFFDGYRFEFSAADVDLEFCAGFGIFRGQVGHRDADTERGREDSAGKFAECFAIGTEDGIMGAGWRSFFGELDGCEFCRRAILLLGGEGSLSDEVGFFEITEEAKTCLNGSDVRSEIVTIEWIAHF